MKIIVSTHQGKLYEEEIDYVVVRGPAGEFAIFKNHLPLVCALPKQWLKLVSSQGEIYLAVVNGFLEFKDDTITIIAQGAHIGKDKESAFEHLKKVEDARKIENQKVDMDLTQKEKEILDNLRKSKAGSL